MFELTVIILVNMADSGSHSFWEITVSFALIWKESFGTKVDLLSEAKILLHTYASMQGHAGVLHGGNILSAVLLPPMASLPSAPGAGANTPRMHWGHIWDRIAPNRILWWSRPHVAPFFQQREHERVLDLLLNWNPLKLRRRSHNNNGLTFWFTVMQIYVQAVSPAQVNNSLINRLK